MLPKSIQNTIEEFSKLPGIGPKTAARLTFYLLTKSIPDIKKLGITISEMKDNLVYCKICYNISETDPCVICDNPVRDKSIICVVEEPLDVLAMEKAGFKGLYHVLGGVISPIDGIGPEHIRIPQLIDRLDRTTIKELILATDPSLEGEATAMYIQKNVAGLIKNGKINKNIKITRLARGLPVGSDLEYADEMTLRSALSGRETM